MLECQRAPVPWQCKTQFILQPIGGSASRVCVAGVIRDREAGHQPRSRVQCGDVGGEPAPRPVRRLMSCLVSTM
jgi:hypothetical protein